MVCLWGGGAKSRKLPVYLWRQGKAVLQGGPPRLENMAMGIEYWNQCKAFVVRGFDEVNGAIDRR